MLFRSFEVHLLDLRNHGRSPHDPIFNYLAMAGDLEEYIIASSLENPVLIGHSMGGKTVMRHSVMHPASSSDRVVVDISPRAFEVRHMDVINAMMSVDFSMNTTRKSVESQLMQLLNDEGTVQLLMKSLYWVTDNQLGWRFDLASISASIQEVGAEGGTISVRGYRDSAGTWVFTILKNSVALLDDDDPPGSGLSESQPMLSWAEVAGELGRYPWYRLYPLVVNPD